MFTICGENGKTWAEIDIARAKNSLIVMKIMLLEIIVYGIYHFSKNKKDR